MFLPRKADENVRVAIASRVLPLLRKRLEARAAQSGYTMSTAIAELLEVALDFEEQLKPFRPAIERLMHEDRLSVVEAVIKLLWMGVEVDPHHE